MGLVFEPGKPEIIDNKVNLWRKPFLTPTKPLDRDINLYRQLFNHVFKNESPENRRWLEQWFAFPLKHVGAKLFTVVLVRSDDQGVGKSLLGEIVASAYGPYGIEVRSGDMGARFNSHWSNALFIVGNEIMGSDAWEHRDALKNFVTNEYTTVEQKGVEAYRIKNHINLYATSNRVRPIAIDPKDRRIVVFRANNEKPDDALIKGIRKWKASEDFGSGVLWYFQNCVGLKGFTPWKEGPTTDAKREMIRLSGSDVGMWLRDWLKDPRDGADVPIRSHAVTLDMIRVLHNTSAPTKPVGPKAMAMALAEELGTDLNLHTEGGNLWIVKPGVTKRVDPKRGDLWILKPGEDGKPKAWFWKEYADAYRKRPLHLRLGGGAPEGSGQTEKPRLRAVSKRNGRAKG